MSKKVSSDAKHILIRCYPPAHSQLSNGSRIFHNFLFKIYIFPFLSDYIFLNQLSPEVVQALRSVRFIAQHIKDADKDNEVGFFSEPLTRDGHKRNAHNNSIPKHTSRISTPLN